MEDSYFSCSISDFLAKSSDEILGELARAHHHALEHQQRGARLPEIEILKQELDQNIEGQIFFEFSIPRIGKASEMLSASQIQKHSEFHLSVSRGGWV